MLVLTRKLYESIQVGPDIIVTVTRIEGDQVRIGITAPRATVVLRQELSEFPRCTRCGSILPEHAGSCGNHPSAGGGR